MTSKHEDYNPNWHTNPPTPECQTNERRISDYLSHTLSAGEAAILQQHLSSCSYCSSLLKSYTLLEQQIKTLTNPPASPRVRAAVLRVVAEGEADRRSLKPVNASIVNPLPRLAGGVAAVALLAVFATAIGMMFNGHGLLNTTTAYASPTAEAMVSGSITPVLGEPTAMGTIMASSPHPTGTPLPAALLVQQVQASANESATNLIFSSVDSIGMTNTVASRANVVKDAPVALSPDQTHAVYTVQDASGTRREVYNFTNRQVAGSVAAVNPPPDVPFVYDLTNAAISPDNKQLAYGSYTDGSWPPLVYDIASGNQVSPNPDKYPVFTTDGSHPVSYLGWGADGLLYTYGGHGSNYTYIDAYDNRNEKHKQIGPASIDMRLQGQPWMSKDGKYIYFAVRIDQSSALQQVNDWQIMRYDVLNGTTSKVIDTGSKNISGPFAEPADNNSLLYIQSDDKGGNLEIHRAGLRSPIDTKVADVKAPDATGNIAVTAMQVCGAILYYQVASDDGKGNKRTQLVAQPLTGSSAATMLSAEGQLIGCASGG